MFQFFLIHRLPRMCSKKGVGAKVDQPECRARHRRRCAQHREGFQGQSVRAREKAQAISAAGSGAAPRINWMQLSLSPINVENSKE